MEKKCGKVGNFWLLQLFHNEFSGHAKLLEFPHETDSTRNIKEIPTLEGFKSYNNLVFFK